MKELSFKMKKAITKRKLKREKLSLLLDIRKIGEKIRYIDEKLEDLENLEEPEPDPSWCLV